MRPAPRGRRWGEPRPRAGSGTGSRRRIPSSTSPGCSRCTRCGHPFSSTRPSTPGCGPRCCSCWRRSGRSSDGAARRSSAPSRPPWPRAPPCSSRGSAPGTSTCTRAVSHTTGRRRAPRTAAGESRTTSARWAPAAATTWRSPPKPAAGRPVTSRSASSTAAAGRGLRCAAPSAARARRADAASRWRASTAACGCGPPSAISSPPRWSAWRPCRSCRTGRASRRTRRCSAQAGSCC